MDKLRLLIVDDEPLATLRMRALLADCTAPAVEVVAEASSGPQALHLLVSQAVDGVLLDIHMPGMDGLALAQRLRDLQPPPAVVFVTAHAEHALQAFEIDAVDYLTKPVRRSRLHEALARMVARLGRVAPAPPVVEPVLDQPVLVVSDRGRVLRVPFDEVVYLKAEMKYVTLRTVRHSHVLDDALSDLEQRLGDAVVRIHRNALVAKAAVRALEHRAPSAHDAQDNAEGWAVRLAPHDEWLSVSRRQLAAVREALTAEGF